MVGMQPETIEKLHTINQEFYQRFGRAFAQTRRRIQPGVRRVLNEWIRDGDWLDIGCGGGVLAQAWSSAGLKGSYLGIDFSEPLLEEAQRLLAENPPGDGLKITFKRVDLAAVDWSAGLTDRLFDGAVCFAALHHIPGIAYRQDLLKQAAALIKPGGWFIHSVWQFQHSPKLMARVKPWALAGLSDADVEEGDTLLDWRHLCDDQDKEPGLRYVHLFSREELGGLAQRAGFEIVDEFESDGQGERLGLYQVWQKIIS